MCVLSAGVLVPGPAAPLCSSQGDLWPMLLKLKVHPQFSGRFTQRSTGYSATKALSLSLPLWPCSPCFLAWSNQATLTTVCIKHLDWVVFTFIVKLAVTRLASGASLFLSWMFAFTEVCFWLFNASLSGPCRQTDLLNILVWHCCAILQSLCLSSKCNDLFQGLIYKQWTDMFKHVRCSPILSYDEKGE